MNSEERKELDRLLGQLQIDANTIEDRQEWFHIMNAINNVRVFNSNLNGD